MTVPLTSTALLLSRLHSKLDEKIATNEFRGVSFDAAYVTELIDQVFQSFQPEQEPQPAPPPPPEIVRVLRVYVFEGERKRVEEQIARSLGDGTRYVNSRPGDGLKDNGIKIHVATVGTIPQILPLNAGYPGWAGKGHATPLDDMPIAEPLGAHLVYTCRAKWATNLRAEYDRAMACGATAIVIPASDDSYSSNLYTLDGFRKVWDYTLRVADTPAPVEATQDPGMPEQAPQDQEDSQK